MKKITLFFTVLMLLASSLAYGQTLTVKGVVSDAGNGEPVPFASIQVKGTMVGAMTDADGNYSIKVDKDAVLIFSFLGYSDSEVPVKGQAVINVSMFPDNNVLDEVVVTGMMVTDKRLFTGSVAKVNAADSKIDGMADISRSLEGRAAVSAYRTCQVHSVQRPRYASAVRPLSTEAPSLYGWSME